MAWELEIHHIDVGQGDATLIVAREFNQFNNTQIQVRSCLIDGGRLIQAQTVHDYITVTAGLNALNVMVATHYDADHFNGLRRLLLINDQNGNVSPMYAETLIFDQGWPGGGVGYEQNYLRYLRAINGMPNDFNNNVLGGNYRTRVTRLVHSSNNQLPPYVYLPDTIAAPQNNVNAINQPANFLVNNEILWWNINLPLGAPTITCIAANLYTQTQNGIQGPFGGNGVDPRNEKSLAFLVQFNNFRYYIGGDLTSVQEDGNAQNSLQAYLQGLGRVHAMKCSHHGSQHSSSQAFINALQPRAAFMSCGINNYFGGNGGQPYLNPNPNDDYFNNFTQFIFPNNHVINNIRQLDFYSINVELTNAHRLILHLINFPAHLPPRFEIMCNDDDVCGTVIDCQGATVAVVNVGDIFDFGFPNGGTITLTGGGTIGINHLPNNTVVTLGVQAELTFDNAAQITITVSNGSTVAAININNGDQITINGAIISFTNEFGSVDIINGGNPAQGTVTLNNGGNALLRKGHPNQRVLNDLQADGNVEAYYLTNDRSDLNRNARRCNLYGLGDNYPQAYSAKAVVAGSGYDTVFLRGNIVITVNENQSNGNVQNLQNNDAQFTVQYTNANVMVQNITHP